MMCPIPFGLQRSHCDEFQMNEKVLAHCNVLSWGFEVFPNPKLASVGQLIEMGHFDMMNDK